MNEAIILNSMSRRVTLFNLHSKYFLVSPASVAAHGTVNLQKKKNSIDLVDAQLKRTITYDLVFFLKAFIITNDSITSIHFELILHFLIIKKRARYTLLLRIKFTNFT